MRIFSYLASRRGTQSHTRALFLLFLSHLEDCLGESVEVTSMQPQDLKLRPCVGCEKCFREGVCPLDKKDGFAAIKGEMMTADLVVLGTPVYGASVSGDMKLFIDRLCYWLHLMPLAGKYGIPLVTASNNNALEVTAYLTRMLESLGTSVPCSIPCTVDNPPMLSDPSFIDGTLRRHAEKVASSYLQGVLTVSPAQERYFTAMKHQYLRADPDQSAEARYWRNQGYFAYASFAALQQDSRTSCNAQGDRTLLEN